MMTMDLDKLTPAPWREKHGQVFAANGALVANTVRGGLVEMGGALDEHAAFIALARNAFDVMMRRGWSVLTDGSEWWIGAKEQGIIAANINPSHSWRDPFTAVIEADRWYRENVEKP